MPYIRKSGASHIALARLARRVHGMGDNGDFAGETGGIVGGVDLPIIDTTSLPVSALLPPLTTPTGPSTPTNWAGILSALTGGAVSGTKIYNSLQTPGLIAGTNAIFNPATGQFYNPTTGQVVNPSGQSTLGLPSTLDSSSLLLYGGLALGAVLLISMMGKH